MQKLTLTLLVVVAAIFSALSTLTGCSSISTKMPVNRFDSPEARGGFPKFHVDPLVFEGSSQLTLVNDYTVPPPPVNFPSFNTSNFDYALLAGLGLLDRLDIDIKFPNSSTTLYQLKYQFLGDTQANSSMGNLSAAVTLAGGYGSESGSSTGFLGTVNSSYTMKQWAWDTSLIVGLKVIGPLLIYTGPFYSQYSISGSITQPSATFAFGGTARQYGYSLGYELAASIFEFKLNVAWAHATFGTQSLSAFYPAVLVGFRF